MKTTLPTEPLLAQIKTRFYDHKQPEKRFHQDRHMLLYALTWPAQWLERQGLSITPTAYQKLLSQRLHDIATHGQPQHYHRYFPRYLLKCIQDWFAHHGDQLYQELKHVRNQLCSIEHLLKQNTQSPEAQDRAQIEHLAAAHQIMRSKVVNKIRRNDCRQLNLF
jgi:hypothetical protein